MSVMLPDPLEWVLDMLGFNWPHADEDKLMECAQVWRTFASEVQGHAAQGTSYAGNVLSENSGDAIDGFRKEWDKFSGGSGYLDDAAQAAEVIAFTLEAAAMLVIGMKVAVIVQLAILAAEIIAAQVAAPFTLGLSEIGGAAATLATREMVRRLLKEVAKQLLDAILEAAKEPVISALEAMASDLIAQTVNQNFGAQNGYNLSRTAKEGYAAGKDALENTGETLGESLRDGAAGRAGHHAHGGLDSAAGHGSDGDGGSGEHGGDGPGDRGGDGPGDRGGDGSEGSGPEGSGPEGGDAPGSRSEGGDGPDGGDRSDTGDGPGDRGDTGDGPATHSPRASDNVGGDRDTTLGDTGDPRTDPASPDSPTT
ncbi:hypothetical protein FNZ23_27855, partial [Streptomyces benahoarensis]